LLPAGILTDTDGLIAFQEKSCMPSFSKYRATEKTPFREPFMELMVGIEEIPAPGITEKKGGSARHIRVYSKVCSPNTIPLCSVCTCKRSHYSFELFCVDHFAASHADKADIRLVVIIPGKFNILLYSPEIHIC